MAGKGTPAVVAAERAGVRFALRDYAHDPKAASYGLAPADLLALTGGRTAAIATRRP